MEHSDDNLAAFAEHGATPLPAATGEGRVERDGARIWYATYGSGEPVILLHGGLGHSGNWGFQVPALLDTGHRVILIDSRGHGRSTRDRKPYTYELLAADVLAVMDRLDIQKAAFAGWSDGACIALTLASQTPERVSGVFFFACNMDPSGTKDIEPSPVLDRCFSRHAEDYRALSATPDDFSAFVDAVSEMQRTEPNYTAEDLGKIRVPVVIVQSENDEFIKHEHADHLAHSIPGAAFILLDGVSHFAPLQRPDRFNAALTAFLVALEDEPKGDAQ
ncbi:MULTISPECIES: alpha/beta fold hydrolase [Ensifer]|uniref:alpha/beta fold hydrolase n=1 Tax=Ensifer TaxID=106591 RepID=UPI000DC43985|nr:MULTISPECIES: alpha/beta hydrolase [Ensifer]MBD9627431.1 alpha/beta fold hydrolase [Ensifer sp. ENS06]RAS02565.1 pimeloyl-ACP methyl ester carboxylesterase [Ensifer adhaerens]